MHIQVRVCVRYAHLNIPVAVDFYLYLYVCVIFCSRLIKNVAYLSAYITVVYTLQQIYRYCIIPCKRDSN